MSKNKKFVHCFFLLNKEALQEAQVASEKARVESINQVIREREMACEEKLAAQKKFDITTYE